MIAKARVAPLKSPTVPRMELTAVMVAVKMYKPLKMQLELKLQDSGFWADSTAVLKYLNSRGTRFKTLRSKKNLTVANRITAILTHSQTTKWRYVTTSLNPNVVSRGQSVEAFLKEDHWLSGPDFIRHPPDQWPRNPDPGMLDINDLEIRSVTQAHLTQVKEMTDATNQLMAYFSSWIKLKRAVAWFLKLKHVLKELIVKKKPGEGKTRVTLLREHLKGVSLTCDDLATAEKEIVKFFFRNRALKRN